MIKCVLKYSRFLCAAVLAIMVLTGCARKPRLDLSGLTVNPPGSGVPVARGDGMFEELPSAPVTGDAAWESTDVALAETGGIIDPITKRWAQVVVYFAYDSAAIGPAERPKLDTLSEHLAQHPEYSVVIEGHCDERGSDEYNRALGETRALVVRDYLCSKGVASERLDTVSYGEDKPVVSAARDQEGHAKNRRAEFVIGIRR